MVGELRTVGSSTSSTPGTLPAVPKGSPSRVQGDETGIAQSGRRIRVSSLLGSSRESMEEKHREHVIGWAQVKCRGGRTIQFWHVCFECHEIIEGPIRKSRVPNRDMIPLWSFKTWCDWRGVDQSEAKRTQQWRANYKDYLRSHEWAAKRRERFDMDNGICCECGAPADHVHHVTYERLGDERMQDLLSVCRPCHSKIHGRPV